MISTNMGNMMHGCSDTIYWPLFLLAPFVISIWPLGRGKRSQMESEQTTPPEEQPAEPVIDHLDWGIRLGMLGRFERAAERFEQAVKDDPEDPAAHYDLALALDQAGHHERAADEYKRAVELAPSFADIRTNLAVALLEQGESEAAVESLQAAVQCDGGDPVPHFDLGCVYMGQRQWRQAIVEFREAAQADPKDAQIRFNLAIALRRAGEVADAERELRDFIALARTRYPEQREYAEKLLNEEYGEAGG